MGRIETIGDCTLYHGDCLEILPTLGRVDACITDPPYLNIGKGVVVNLDNGVSARRNTNRTVSDPWQANLDWAAPSYALARKSFFSFCSFHFINDLCGAVGGKLSAIVTWYQRNAMPPMANAPHYQTEFCVVYRKERGVEWRRLKTMIDIPRLQSGCMAGERIVDHSGQAVHPSQKPVHLIKRLLVPGLDSIVDPFSGTGTTGVACVELGRKFIGIELDEKYFDIACRRIEQAVKKQSCKLPGFSAKAKAVQVSLPL